MREIRTSRFIERTDPRSEKFFFTLPKDSWWSRLYEYEWAKNFAGPSDVVLDAACGICHPFKFYLSDVCKEVYACDLDKRVASPRLILEDIKQTFGQEVRYVSDSYFKKIKFSHCDITNLPYDDKKFDKLFCVSVLEHLEPTQVKLALEQFKRVIKDDGLIILTIDYPTLQLNVLQSAIANTGLQFAGKAIFELQGNAIFSDYFRTNRLYCFRVLLKNAVSDGETKST